MKVCSLFSGIGGIDLAFEQLGHTIVWANDIDKYACATYRHNFPSSHIIEGNIQNIDLNIIPDFDILTAGFPCQPFSVCGKKLGFADERGSLFYEIGKVIDMKQPQIVFFENVANLAKHDSGKTFNVVHNELASRDYYIRYIIAEACEYGNVPQHRTRIYILAFKDKEMCDKFVFPDKQPLTIKMSDVIDLHTPVAPKYYYSSDSAQYTKLLEKVTDCDRLYRFADFGLQMSEKNIAFTLKANMGTYYNRIPIIKDDFGIRKITPQECLALQGFPKEFVFPDVVPEKEQYKQAGNTVCVPVVKNIIANLQSL